MLSFLNKFRKSSGSISEKDEFYTERKQLSALHNYYSHSLLYLERLDSSVKDINIMISDLNSCLLSFFENDSNGEMIKQVSFILNMFTSVRDKVSNEIMRSKYVVKSTLERIKGIRNLCARKLQLHNSIGHYEKKLRKLRTISQTNQKHLDRIIRNENKLNKVKSDYISCHDNIKKGFCSILDNKTNKILSDARRDLEILLYYFSLMNAVSSKLKDPLKDLEISKVAKKKSALSIEDNFFLQEEDRMNYFTDKSAKYNPNYNDGTNDGRFTNSRNTHLKNNYHSKGSVRAEENDGSTCFNLKRTFLKFHEKSLRPKDDGPYFPQ